MISSWKRAPRTVLIASVSIEDGWGVVVSSLFEFDRAEAMSPIQQIERAICTDDKVPPCHRFLEHPARS